jgi:hypothetical protein
MKELQLFLNNLIEIIRDEETTIDYTIFQKQYKTGQKFKNSNPFICYNTLVLKVLKENHGLNNIIPFLTNYIYQQHVKNDNFLINKRIFK